MNLMWKMRNSIFSKPISGFLVEATSGSNSISLVEISIGVSILHLNCGKKLSFCNQAAALEAALSYSLLRISSRLSELK